MAHDFPATVSHGLADVWVVLEYSQICGSGATHSVLVKDIQHPPETNPIPVVTMGVALDLGMR